MLHRDGKEPVMVTRFTDPKLAEYIAAELRGALADAFHAGATAQSLADAFEAQS
jgi:hypothetical protein